MIDFIGKYTNAKVMIDAIDNTTAAQITEFINNEAFTNPIAIMPDCHAGKGAVIGFTMEVTDKVIPNVIGVDIGCGMLSFRTNKSFLSAMRKEEVDTAIRSVVPFGSNVRKSESKHFRMQSFVADVRHRLSKFHREYQKRYNVVVPFPDFDERDLETTCKVIGMDYGRALHSIGSLGGGNHFIEIGKGEESGEYWVTIHCGSRNFGKNVAEFWQKQAVKNAGAPTVSKDEYVQWVKRNFVKKEYATEIAKYAEKYGKKYVAKGSEYLVGDDMFMYLFHMVIAQTYAEWNRKIIMAEILDVMGVSMRESIETTHNFIDFEDWIIRKGAIRSYVGEKMIIPWNMEDGLTICEGKSNPEWNFSAPHGAGRVFSRSEAKRRLNLEDAKESMKAKGIYSSNIPLDEVKDAYKSAEVIEICIEPTATIIDRVRPVLNMKE